MLYEVISELKYLISYYDSRIGINGALYFFYKTAYQSISLNQLCDFRSLMFAIPIRFSGSLWNSLLSKSRHESESLVYFYGTKGRFIIFSYI